MLKPENEIGFFSLLNTEDATAENWIFNAGHL